MSCPRCGLKIGPSAPGRCPRCFQPLHPPFSQSARITKLTPDSEVIPFGGPLEDEVWPDLNSPPLSPVQRALSSESPRSLFMPPDAFVISTVTEMGRRRPAPRRVLLLAAAVVVLLGLIFGGTLVAVGALTGQGHTSGRPSARTGLTNTAGVATSTASATATASATPSPAVVQAPTAHPTVTPTPAPKLITIFSDPLTSNINGWTAPEGCSFQSDGLHVTSGAQCIAPVTAADTVNISVQMETVGVSLGGAGIGFRIPGGHPSHQYTFYLYFNSLCVAQDLVTHTKFFDTVCPAAHEGMNAVNTLAINQSGAHMDFYVNGTLVGSADDTTLETGEVALEVQKNQQSVIFTNFALTTLK